MSDLAKHPVFERLKMVQLHGADFDRGLETSRDEVAAVFFWGHDCPNCEVAKRLLFEESAAVESFGFKWFHVNTYEDFELGTRFGLFGIPTFLFFFQGKKLGKITPFPGIEAFTQALRELRAKYPAAK